MDGGRGNKFISTHHRVSLSPDQQLDASILQREGADGAAFTVGHEQAAPGLLRGQSQAWRLSEARLVGVGVVSVLLAAAAGPAHARSRLQHTVKEKVVTKQWNTSSSSKARLLWLCLMSLFLGFEGFLLPSGHDGLTFLWADFHLLETEPRSGGSLPWRSTARCLPHRLRMQLRCTYIDKHTKQNTPWVRKQETLMLLAVYQTTSIINMLLIPVLKLKMSFQETNFPGSQNYFGGIVCSQKWLRDSAQQVWMTAPCVTKPEDTKRSCHHDGHTTLTDRRTESQLYF